MSSAFLAQSTVNGEATKQRRIAVNGLTKVHNEDQWWRPRVLDCRMPLNSKSDLWTPFLHRDVQIRTRGILSVAGALNLRLGSRSRNQTHQSILLLIMAANEGFDVRCEPLPQTVPSRDAKAAVGSAPISTRIRWPTNPARPVARSRLFRGACSCPWDEKSLLYGVYKYDYICYPGRTFCAMISIDCIVPSEIRRRGVPTVCFRLLSTLNPIGSSF